MTPEQQVRAALKLIAPPASERAACRADIENMLDVIESFGKSDKIFAAARSEATTKALAAYHDALGRLRTTYKAVLATGGGHPLRRAADGSWREVLTLADIDFLIEASIAPPEACRVFRPFTAEGAPPPRHPARWCWSEVRCRQANESRRAVTRPARAMVQGREDRHHQGQEVAQAGGDLVWRRERRPVPVSARVSALPEALNICPAKKAYEKYLKQPL